jgi:hypothetical protein
MKRTAAAAAVAALSLLFLGCPEKDGPLENAGEELDDATDSLRDAVEDVGDEVEDATEDAREAVEDAAEEIDR